MPLARQRSRADSLVHPLLLLLSLLLALPLLTVPAAAQPTIGGDDRVACTESHSWTGYAIDIAENGDIYVAMGVEDTITHDATSIRIVRSTDGGQLWLPWATVTDPLPHQIVECTMRVAEGLHDHIYLAYTLRGTENPSYVRVATSELSSPSFSFVTVKYDNNNGFTSPRLASDEMNVTAYHMFLALEGGGGIWFSRSSDYGATWDAPYIVGPCDESTPWQSEAPDLAYGRNGVLHLVYQYARLGEYDSSCVHYRRATNYAASLADWDTELRLTSSLPDQSFWRPTVAASHGSDKVIVTFDQYRYRYIIGWSYRYPKLRLSTNAGVSWLAADTVALASSLDHSRALALPSTGGFRISAWQDTVPGFIEATDASPLSWSSFQQMADRAYNGAYNVIAPYMDYDLSRSNQLGLLWISYHSNALPDSAIFDAEWRGGGGYPKLEPGFPRDLTTSAISPPAMVDVDGDGTYTHQEIVFGDAAGNVQVLDHNGDPLAGWPQDVGTIPTDAPVAVSDVDGDGEVELAVGNTAGHVYLFQHDGTPESGWPLDLGTDAGVYVSIGGLVSGGGPGHGGLRQIVACSGNQVHVLRSDATEVGIWPQTFNGTLLAQAAIGDINDDGVRDVVAVGDSVVEAWDAAGRLLFKRTLPAGNVLANAPTLADVDLDGNLEIAVPTDSGRVYLVHHDGANVLGWPAGRTSFRTATSVAFADLIGDAAPELVYGQRDSCIQMLEADASTASGWPRYTGTGSYYIVYGQPVVAPIDLAGRSVLYGSRNSYAYAWPATGVAPKDGWPREIWDHCNVSPAVGETDGDGHIEVAFTTLGSISIFEFSPYAAALPTQVWPMYAYDPARTGCLACDNTPLVDVPGPTGAPTALRFALPRPNPARGVVSLAYDLPRASTVRLTLIDVTGRMVRTLVKAEQGAGTYEARWDGTGARGEALSPGVYFARLSVGDATGEKTLTRKVVRVE